MGYKVATQPTAEPFERAYIKGWLKIPASVTAEDTIVDAIISSARDWAERGSGRALMTQTIEEYFDCWPSCGVFELSVSPIQSITSVSYLSGGSYVTWDAVNYQADLFSEPCRLAAKNGVTHPSTDLRALNAFKVVYVAGYASAALIPGTTKDAMLQRIAFLYENREDIPISNNDKQRLRSADALLSKNRVM